MAQFLPNSLFILNVYDVSSSSRSAVRSGLRRMLCWDFVKLLWKSVRKRGTTSPAARQSASTFGNRDPHSSVAAEARLLSFSPLRNVFESLEHFVMTAISKVLQWLWWCQNCVPCVSFISMLLVNKLDNVKPLTCSCQKKCAKFSWLAWLPF